MRLGINFYNDQKYDDAAAAFRKVLETEPNNRDAIYNLANTYYAMKDNAKLIETSARLLQVEPMSENALQLLGAGYKNVNNIDKAIKIAERSARDAARCGGEGIRHALRSGQAYDDRDRPRRADSDRQAHSAGAGDAHVRFPGRHRRRRRHEETPICR